MWLSLFVVGSLLCSKRFFSGYSGFPLSSKTNISKFQFDQESGRWRTTLWMWTLNHLIPNLQNKWGIILTNFQTVQFPWHTCQLEIFSNSLNMVMWLEAANSPLWAKRTCKKLLGMWFEVVSEVFVQSFTGFANNVQFADF